VVDDHAIVREGLRLLLSGEPGIDVVGEVRDGAEAVKLATALHPDVILMDLVMPGMVLKRCRTSALPAQPGAGVDQF
jgi:DNA-binding NarL/FixJ family response regulator